MDHEAILKMAGLVELPERKLWVNPDLRKAFSDEAIRDHDSQWLNEHLAEEVPAAEFWFYFNSVPDNANQTCREVLVLLRLYTLEAIVRIGTFPHTV